MFVGEAPEHQELANFLRRGGLLGVNGWPRSSVQSADPENSTRPFTHAERHLALNEGLACCPTYLGYNGK